MKRVNRILLFLLFALVAFSTISLLRASELPLNDFEDETMQWEQRLEQRQKAWRLEKDPARKQELATGVKEAAIHSGNIEAVEEILAGGDPSRIQIEVPDKSQKVSVTILKEFPLTIEAYTWPVPLVARRITSDRFELWTNETGWLFDAKGKLLNTAKVPRRDGHGREWFGAFLPDGRWITTDLWERDDSIHFFSASGKFLKSIPAKTWIPKPKEDDYQLSAPGLVGWARSAKDGKSWIVSIGSEFTSGCFRITPDYRGQPLDAEHDIWQQTWPRDMGSRGMYIASSNRSDDGKAGLARSEAGHGMNVGFPLYGSGTNKDLCIPEAGQNFGFWPGSQGFYVGREKYLLPPLDPAPQDLTKTWFFNEESKTLAWIDAERLCDAADNKSMWFVNADGRVIELSPKLEVKATRKFSSKGTVLFPHKLYPDLKLGFFFMEGKVQLGRW